MMTDSWTIVVTVGFEGERWTATRPDEILDLPSFDSPEDVIEAIREEGFDEETIRVGVVTPFGDVMIVDGCFVSDYTLRAVANIAKWDSIARGIDE